MLRKRSTLYKTGAGVLCAGLFYGFVLIPWDCDSPACFTGLQAFAAPAAA